MAGTGKMYALVIDHENERTHVLELAQMPENHLLTIFGSAPLGSQFSVHTFGTEAQANAAKKALGVSGYESDETLQ